MISPSIPLPLACGPEDQAARRAAIFQKLRYVKRPELVEKNGRWLIPYLDNDGNRFTHPDYRMVLWLALAFFAGDEQDVDIANRLIEGVDIHHSCHFSAVTAAVLLTSHKPSLKPSVVAKLEKFLAGCFGDFMTNDLRFHGANDNAPLGACAALSLGGSYFGNPSLVAFAKDRLHGLAEYLDLHGYLHECVSPTYTGISLADIAELAGHSPDAETRELSLKIERRIWQEALMHYHPGIGYWAGPYSRAYCADRDGHINLLTLTFHVALGFGGYLDPMEMVFAPHRSIRYHNSWDFLQRSFAGQAAPEYHPPEDLVAQALSKPYPLEIVGSNSWMNTGYAPSSVSALTCHMEPDHAVSSFGSNLMAGQCVPFHVLIKRTDQPCKPGDIRSIYSRMWLSDAFDSLSERSLPVAEADFDNGSAFSIQHDNTVLLGYVPCAQGTRNLATVRTTLYFPLFGSCPDEVWCGEDAVSGFSATFSRPAWVFIRERDTYLAVHPLLSERIHCALGLIKLGVRDEMAMLSFYNMCDFLPHSLDVESQRALGGGFVCEVGNRATHGGFEAFRHSFADAALFDEQWNGVRSMEFRHGKTRLQLQYDYKFLNLVRAVANGILRRDDIKLRTVPPLKLID